MRKVAGEIPDTSHEVVSDILQKVIGYPALSIRPIKGVGMNNSVTVAESTEGEFVVRTNLPSHLFRYKREAWCFDQLGFTPVRTPKVIGIGILHDHSYSVAPFIQDSTPIHDTIDTIRVWEVLGMYAWHLNSIHPPKPTSDEATYFPISWEDQVKQDIDLIWKDDLWISSGVLSHDQSTTYKEMLHSCATVEAPHRISQFDLSIANAVICNSNYEQIYLLDLEAANVAPAPFYQLACIAADRGPVSEATAAFFRGYGLNEKKLYSLGPHLNRFILYRLMRATAWARDRYPALLEENLKRTRLFLNSVEKTLQ
jgi:hypothetical protein